jgi:hypothetical protein
VVRWLTFGWGVYLALEKEVEKCEVTKKGRQNFSDGNLWRLVSVLKKVVKYFGRPLSKFLNTPLHMQPSIIGYCRGGSALRQGLVPQYFLWFWGQQYK